MRSNYPRYPWFQKFNPRFDWSTNALEGDDVIVETAGYHKRHQPTIRLVQPPLNKPTDRNKVIKLIPEQYHRHWKVFSEQALYCFPPAQEEDHAIILKLGAPSTIDC